MALIAISGLSPPGPRQFSATESIALPPLKGEARCNVVVPIRQNLFRIASPLSLGRLERKPLDFHLARSAMPCLKKHGWPTPGLTWRIGRTRPHCDHRSRPLFRGTRSCPAAYPSCLGIFSTFIMTASNSMMRARNCRTNMPPGRKLPSRPARYWGLDGKLKPDREWRMEVMDEFQTPCMSCTSTQRSQSNAASVVGLHVSKHLSDKSSGAAEAQPRASFVHLTEPLLEQLHLCLNRFDGCIVPRCLPQFAAAL